MLEFAGFHARLCRTLLTQMLEFVTYGQSLDREVPVAGAIHCGSVGFTPSAVGMHVSLMSGGQVSC
jgi:hypothetical protein